MTPRSDSLTAFVWWGVVGAGLCLGVLSLLTIGAFVLLATFALCGFLLWRLQLGWGMAGVFSGAALPVLYVAWLDRDGPGTVCHAVPGGRECTDEGSPWPFVVVAVVLLVVGVTVFVRGRRREAL